MKTVGTRELKQNPQEVIRRVAENGEELQITSYGRPTGVRIVSDEPTPRRWVSGAALSDLPEMDAANAEAWQADVANAVDDDVRDPWEQA